MSIDTRLSDGLRAEVELVERTDPVDVVDTWAEVLDRSRRETRRRQARVAALAVAAVAAVAVVVAVATRPSDDVEPAPPSPSPTATQTTDAVPAGSPVEDKWVTDAAPVQRVYDHLVEEGYDEYAQTVMEGLRPDLGRIRADQTVAFQLILQEGQLVGGVSIDDDRSTDVDVQDYDVRGDRIAFIQQGTGCEALFTWAVRDDRLRLRLLDDPCGPYQGTPDGAYLTALYTTLPFRPAP